MRDYIIQAKLLTKEQLSFLYKKVLNFIIEDSQPFYILESKSFKKLLLALHTFFEMPTEEALDKLLDFMFDDGQTFLKNIFEDIEKISLTTDFWTSRGQHDYIGVTAHWISNDYSLKEAFLALKHVPYPYISEVIKDELKKIIINWNISNKVTFITTDNAASMVKAVRLLGGEFVGIERISCASYTLQLVIEKALTCNVQIQIFILRVKRLVHFFSSPKQLEHLIAAQEQLNYPKTYRVIKDVKTRWNSSFYSWQRLFLLKRALTFLPSKLKADHVKENTNDGKRLERIMLTEGEWQLMENLVEFLKRFEEITRLLGGSKYVTLSLVYPLIFLLKNYIKDMLEIYQKDSNYNENTNEILSDDNVQDEILEEFEEIPDSEVADIIAINEKGTKKNFNISTPIETKGLIVLFLEALDGSLKKYWSVPSNIGLLATLLDPRSKKLLCFNESEKQQATILLIKRYELFNSEENKTVSGDEVEDRKEENFDYFDLNNKDKTLINSILGREESEGEEENEVDVYLKFKSSKNVNPLSWWKVNEKKFPFLSKVSKEYFEIAATSVPSERLFSDVGNLITTKHSSLKPEKVEKLIFLKRNASLFDN